MALNTAVVEKEKICGYLLNAEHRYGAGKAKFFAAFGFTVMGRVALLIGRLNFLILDWIYPLIGIR